MRIIPTTTTVAALVRQSPAHDPGVLFARVSKSITGAKAEQLGVVRDLNAATQADTAKAADGARGSLTIVLPAQDCFIKPIAMSTATFLRARDEVQHTVDELFPIAADDALIGLIDRNTATKPAANQDTSDNAEAGYLLAAQAARVQQAIDAIENATGKRATRIITPHMAALGLSAMQRAEDRDVLIAEQDQAGNAIHHIYNNGKAQRLGVPAPPDATPDAAFPASLDADGVRKAFDLATAAALIDDTAPGTIAPMLGPATSRTAHWAAPITFAAAAAALLLCTGIIADARFAAAADHADNKAAALQTDYEQAAADRQRLQALAARVERAHQLGFPTPGRTLADIYAAGIVLPPDAYFTRIELTPARALLDGVATSSGDVLQRLEASEAFESAAREMGSTRVPGNASKETFSLSATRRFDDRSEAAQ